MTRYIKDDSGKFAGSIGDGATNVPTAAPDIFLPATAANTEDATSQAIHQAYAAFSRRQENPFVPDFADPETTDAVLKKIDKIGERFSRRLDDISERQYDIRAGRSYAFNKHYALEELRREEEKLRDAAMTARENLEAARAIMEDREPQVVPYQRYATLEADDVSWEASQLRDIFGEEDLQHDWDRGDAAVLDKVTRASRHILQAKRALNAAIVPEKRDPEPEEELDEN